MRRIPPAPASHRLETNENNDEIAVKGGKTAKKAPVPTQERRLGYRFARHCRRRLCRGSRTKRNSASQHGTQKCRPKPYRLTLTRWLIQYERCQSVSHYAAEGLLRSASPIGNHAKKEAIQHEEVYGGAAAHGELSLQVGVSPQVCVIQGTLSTAVSSRSPLVLTVSTCHKVVGGSLSYLQVPGESPGYFFQSCRRSSGQGAQHLCRRKR